jgi:hypothetical protein
MLSWVTLLGAFAFTTVAARPATRTAPAGPASSTRRTAVTVAAICAAAVIAGLALSRSDAVGGVYAASSSLVLAAGAAAYLHLALRWHAAVASAAAGALLGAYSITAASPAQPTLVIAGCLGAAALISYAFNGSGCLLMICCLTVSDLLLWQTGTLEQFQFAGVSSVALHPLAAVNLGTFTLGAGDLLCAALLGAWVRGNRPRAGAPLLAAVTVQLAGVTALATLAASASVTLPATVPTLAAAAAAAAAMKFSGEKPAAA